ncbi:MAG: hypothetical protein AAB263_20645 [Planctomycetota bacterium]
MFEFLWKLLPEEARGCATMAAVLLCLILAAFLVGAVAFSSYTVEITNSMTGDRACTVVRNGKPGVILRGDIVRDTSRTTFHRMNGQIVKWETEKTDNSDKRQEPNRVTKLTGVDKNETFEIVDEDKKTMVKIVEWPMFNKLIKITIDKDGKAKVVK